MTADKVGGVQAVSRLGVEHEDVTAARILLERLGVSPEDLILDASAAGTAPVPTFREYVPIVAAATSAASAATWSVYWRVLAEKWGDTPIDTPSASELLMLANEVQAQALRRRGSRDGQSAKACFVDATRHLYLLAQADQYISASRNPAAQLRKPRRAKSVRRALTSRQLIDINMTAASTGTDPALDTLLLRLHTETACRRGGALALRPCDVNDELCTIRLREKGGTTREQPVSPTLTAGLLAHAHARPGAGPRAGLLRHRDGSPISASRYASLWSRLHHHLPWIGSMGITAHWIRYTTLTWVERNYGYAIAASFAGHATLGYQTSTTMTYVAATVDELAVVVAALTGEPHPLAA
ncbi:site-specific integrase [Amycolatopsis sp. CA-128772]|uniref:tyrosine-type recombinase/integrase n=1 Tax=Amycolatopsis sp. CA-128772 TaxID=2073159 RepID=UPI0011B0A615|nr:site-specific integrase [Amycolatopsis sp. CA-128772]